MWNSRWLPEWRWTRQAAYSLIWRVVVQDLCVRKTSYNHLSQPKIELFSSKVHNNNPSSLNVLMWGAEFLEISVFPPCSWGSKWQEKKQKPETSLFINHVAVTRDNPEGCCGKYFVPFSSCRGTSGPSQGLVASYLNQMTSWVSWGGNIDTVREVRKGQQGHMRPSAKATQQLMDNFS